MEMYAFNYIASAGAAEHRDYSYSATDQNCATSSHSTTDILEDGFNSVFSGSSNKK